MTSISAFLTHPELLGRDFAASSWDAWKLTLKAAFGESLTDVERERFCELADRDPPAKRVREIWAAIGRRAGKDSIASAIATYLAVNGDFARQLRRGEVATILCLACTREQASIVFGYIKANFETIPALKALLVSARDDVVTLSNGVEIVIGTASFRHLRGKTVAAAIFDEVAFWKDETSANPDTAIYNAVLPSMITLRDSGAMIIGISSVHRRGGLLHEKIVGHLGKDDNNVLSILQPSVAFNPLLLAEDAQAEIERQLALDPEAAAAEWLSRWRDDLSDMFDAALVAQAVDKDRRVNFPRSGVTYLMAADASGGRGDAFTCAVGHRDGDVVIIDRVAEWRAPFDVDVVMDAVADIARDYRVARIAHDDYGADLVVAGFRRRGLISQQIAIRDKGKDYRLNRSEIYLDALPAFTAGRVRIPDEPRLIHQLVGLERRPASSGRDVVDHPKTRGSHDDMANACCAAIVLLASKTPFIVTREHVIAASRPPGSIRVRGDDMRAPDWRRNATPMERMRADHPPPWERPDPPPGRRTILYVSPATLSRARAPGAWTKRSS